MLRCAWVDTSTCQQKSLPISKWADDVPNMSLHLGRGLRLDRGALVRPPSHGETQLSMRMHGIPKQLLGGCRAYQGIVRPIHGSVAPLGSGRPGPPLPGAPRPRAQLGLSAIAAPSPSFAVEGGSDTKEHLQGLSGEQQASVAAPLGTSLVVAGPGSGKTRVLISRILHLVQAHDVAPHSIAAITFTNKVGRGRSLLCGQKCAWAMWGMHPRLDLVQVTTPRVPD